MEKGPNLVAASDSQMDSLSTLIATRTSIVREVVGANWLGVISSSFTFSFDKLLSSFLPLPLFGGCGGYPLPLPLPFEAPLASAEAVDA